MVAAMSVTSVMVAVKMVVMVVVMIGMIPVIVSPTVPIRIPAPIAVVGITPIRIPTPVIAAPVWTIAPTDIIARVVIPIEGIVAVYINIGISAAIACVVVIIIADGRGGSCAETLDAGCKIGIVISFGGGINHAVGVGHRFSGLIHGFGIADVILAVGIISLVVVLRIAADAWADIRAVVSGQLPALVAIRRVIDIVLGHVSA